MNCKNLILPVLAGLLATGCATQRLAEGEYRLAGNKIKVEGKEVSHSELTSYLAQKPSASFLGIRRPGAQLVLYDDSQVNTSSDNIINHLEYIGYYGSKVRSEVQYKRKRAYVTYYVTPGKRYTIRSIDFELPQDEEFRKEFETDRPRITIKEGQYLAESTLEAETVRSAEFFRNRGYYGFDKSFYFCEADTLSHDGTAALTMAIRDYPRNGSPEEAKPHRKFTIGNVTLSYPKEIPIRTSVLEELNVLHPGLPYSERAVNATYSRLSNLSVFNSVNVTMNPVSDNVVDCDINLLNGGVQGFKANLEASVNSTGLFGISPQLNYFHKNFFHGGELFNLGLKGNFQFKTKDKIRSTEFSVSSSLRIPKLIGLPNSLFRGTNLPHTDLTLGFSYQDRPEYKRMMISTSFGYTGNFRRNFTYQFFPFQANIVRLGNISESFAERLVADLFLLNAYSDHFDMGMGGTLYYTTDPTPIPKRTYTYGRLSFDLAGNVLSLFNSAMPTNQVNQHTIWQIPYAQYVRGELQLGHTFLRLWQLHHRPVREAVLCRRREQHARLAGPRPGPGPRTALDRVLPHSEPDGRLQDGSQCRIPLPGRLEAGRRPLRGRRQRMEPPHGRIHGRFQFLLRHHRRRLGHGRPREPGLHPRPHRPGPQGVRTLPARRRTPHRTGAMAPVRQLRPPLRCGLPVLMSF